MTTWKDDVYSAVKRLNKPARLKEIYLYVKEIREERGAQLPIEYPAIIRRTLQENSKEAKSSLNKESLFRPTEGLGQGVWELDITEASLARENIESLREKAYSISSITNEPKQQTQKRRDRNRIVQAYAKRRANGYCECCGEPAPFLDKNKEPFLEVHHIIELSQGGEDSPNWVAAITPNCHRRIHLGIDGEEINKQLQKKIQTKEDTLDASNNR